MMSAKILLRERSSQKSIKKRRLNRVETGWEGGINKSQFCGCNLSSASFGALPLINGAAAVCLSHSDDHDIEGGGWRKGMKGAGFQILRFIA